MREKKPPFSVLVYHSGSHPGCTLKLSRELFFKNQIFLVWDWAGLKALQVILSAAGVETYCIIMNNLATYLQSSLTHRAFSF